MSFYNNYNPKVPSYERMIYIFLFIVYRKRKLLIFIVESWKGSRFNDFNYTITIENLNFSLMRFKAYIRRSYNHLLSNLDWVRFNWSEKSQYCQNAAVVSNSYCVNRLVIDGPPKLLLKSYLHKYERICK